MSNQHYVPRFYFRNFCQDRFQSSSFGKERRRINLPLAKNNSIILNAGIDGQCVQRDFYGDAEIEQALCSFEERHAPAIAKLLDISHERVDAELSSDDYVQLLGAVLFQRSRTLLEAEKQAPSIEGLAVSGFRQHIACSEHEQKQEILNVIDAGNFQVKVDRKYVLLQAINRASQSIELLLDLRLVLVRNFTNVPFVFSDSPVIFYNSHYWKIKNRRVLGLQTPGLQIFFPLDPYTQVVLFDPLAYESPRGRTVDLHTPADVSNLNALQVHHSMNAVYFSFEQDAEYVFDLYRCHAINRRSPQHRYGKLGPDLEVKDVLPGQDVLHSFEPQINHRLKLSFIRPLSKAGQSEFSFRHRSPAIVAEHRKWLEQLDVARRVSRSSS